MPRSSSPVGHRNVRLSVEDATGSVIPGVALLYSWRRGGLINATHRRNHVAQHAAALFIALAQSSFTPLRS